MCMEFPELSSAGERFAWLVSGLLHPAVLGPVTGIYLLMGSALNLSGALFFTSLWVLLCVLPTLVVASFVSETGLRVGRRSQRWKPELAVFLSSLFTLGVSYWLGAPDIVLEAGAVLAITVPVWAGANCFDKLSVHVGTAAAAFAMLSSGLLSPVIAIVAVVLVAWSRLVLDAHTPVQVIQGGLLGGVIAAAFLVISGPL
jgi:PAP2 superfamily.